MPELPEVETIRRGLTATVLDRRVERIGVLWQASLHRRIDQGLAGRHLIEIRRRGKLLIGDLSDGGTCSSI